MNKLTLAALGATMMFGAANAVDLWHQAAAPAPGPDIPGWSSVQGTISSLNLNREVADDFVVGGPGWVVDQVVMRGTWFTGENRNPTGGFIVSFYAMVSGAPANTASATQTSTSVARSASVGNYAGRDAFDFTIDLAPVGLNAGTYFMAVQAVDSVNFFWIVANANQGADSHVRDTWRNQTGGGGANTYPEAWTPLADIGGDPQDMAFTIRGTVVPEPATIAVIGLGLAALAARRRRK